MARGLSAGEREMCSTDTLTTINIVWQNSVMVGPNIPLVVFHFAGNKAPRPQTHLNALHDRLLEQVQENETSKGLVTRVFHVITLAIRCISLQQLVYYHISP